MTQSSSPYPGKMTKEQMIDRILRVDHAGEYGAVRIYQGQLAILGDKHPLSPTIQHMKDQEDYHLDRFSQLIRDRATRPSLLTPFWHVAGFALGAGTALLGDKAAMVCTEAVETVIDQHYADQIEELDAEFGNDEAELKEELEKFRLEEVEHRDTAVELGAHDAHDAHDTHDAHDALGYHLLSGLIKSGCRTVIKIAERV